jgi:chloride channel protein, CIC family
MFGKQLDRFRLRLADADALAPLVVLGILSGAASGALLLSFRALVELILTSTVSPGDPEAFEQLRWELRFALPMMGAALIAWLFSALGPTHAHVGIVHVMERLAYHHGRMPWRNAVAQYVGALISLCAGHSMGREGPGVHLGAAAGSWVGNGLGVPNNSMRILIACGTAGSIAASFNTPIAGVIFAMEVVMMEYTIVGFTPVILASAVAAWMSRAVYGADAAFALPALELSSLLELPFVIFVGVTMGLVATVFVRTTQKLQTVSHSWSLRRRFGLAGLIMGAAAVVAPSVMGIGYDTVEATLSNELSVQFLLLILVVKMVASISCAGLGLPAGVIAPMLFIGATAGATLGIIGHEMAPSLSSNPGFYAILGMGALMAACLHAPLAALMAILELTANVNIMLPGMVCIVSAVLVARSGFRLEPMFVALLRVRGGDYVTDPVALALSRSGVTMRMSTDLEEFRDRLPTPAVGLTNDRRVPRWLVLIKDGKASLHDTSTTDPSDSSELAALLAGEAVATDEISVRATVQEAREALGASGAQALLVRRLDQRICGVLTMEMLGATALVR